MLSLPKHFYRAVVLVEQRFIKPHIFIPFFWYK
jgi:hypothetical protein